LLLNTFTSVHFKRAATNAQLSTQWKENNLMKAYEPRSNINKQSPPYQTKAQFSLYIPTSNLVNEVETKE